MSSIRAVAVVGSVFAIALALVPPKPAAAEAPLSTRPIRLVVSLGPGSGPDAIARRLADKLAPTVGQSVLVENRPGVSGILAADTVAKSSPDGSTLAFAMGSTIAIAPHVYSKVPYDTLRDLKPVIQVGATPFILLVNAADPAKTLAQFIANAKANPNTVSFASFGNGTAAHLMGEELSRVAQIQMVHVPYKTSAIPDLIGGRINASIGDIGTARAHLGTGGKLRALAVSGASRNSAFPEVPTFGEQGFPSFDVMVGWVGIFAPAATPAPITARWAQEVVAILKTEDMRSSMVLLGYEPTGQTNEAFAQIVRRDHDRWGKVVKDMGGITLD